MKRQLCKLSKNNLFPVLKHLLLNKHVIFRHNVFRNEKYRSIFDREKNVTITFEWTYLEMNVNDKNIKIKKELKFLDLLLLHPRTD